MTQYPIFLRFPVRISMLLTLLFVCGGLLLFSLSSCQEDLGFALEPTLVSATIDKSQIQQLALQSNPPEGFVVSVEFEDGDGDIGQECGDQEAGCPEANAFLVDSRTGFVDSLVIPFISPNGNIQAISGSIDFEITSECCIAISGISCFPDAEYPPTQEVTFDVFIKDRAGNVSNTVTTPPLTLICTN